MLTIHPAKNLQGKLDLPPSNDLFFLAVLVALARRSSLTIKSPFPEGPQITAWQQIFSGHVTFTPSDGALVIQPVLDDPSIRIAFPSVDIPWRDITVFTLLALKKTVVFSDIHERRIAVWQACGRRFGLTIQSSPWEGATCLTADAPIVLPAKDTVVDEQDQDALCGILLGASLSHVFTSNSVVLSPLRNVASLFGYLFEVKNAIPKERDALARRIQMMQQKNRPATAGQQFIVTADFGVKTDPVPVTLTLPGDALFAGVFIVAKCLYPKSSFVMSNVLLETWATLLLSFLRKLGCKVSVQETGRTSFGSVGILQIQSGEMIGRKLTCIPTVRFLPYLPLLAVVASFAKGESVFRDCADLRNDAPDGIARIESCLRSLGVRHGEMPDGIVLQGGVDFDGFDLAEALPPNIAAAFTIAATRCIGDSTINDEQLCAYFPFFSHYLGTLFESRTANEKN